MGKSARFKKMLKGLFLLFEPISCWEGVAHARPGWFRVIFLNVIPMLVMMLVAEGYHLLRWGKWQDVVGHQRIFSRNEVIVLLTAQFIIWLLLLLVCAMFVKALAQTFHNRGSYQLALAVVGFSLAPLFLINLFNALPFVSFWMTFVVGIAFSVRALYHGLPRVMEPDPIHAFGLFLTSTMVIVVTCAMLRFVTSWYYRGHANKLDEVISSLAAQLPF